jgi:hypothetical protein
MSPWYMVLEAGNNIFVLLLKVKKSKKKIPVKKAIKNETTEPVQK